MEILLEKEYKDVTVEDLKSLGFKFYGNDDCVLSYWGISNPRYELKIDPWKRFYFSRNRALSRGFSPFVELIPRDYSYFVQLVETFTNL